MARLSTTRLVLLAALCAPALSADGADTPLKRPSAASRHVRTYDFEEQDFNQEPVPQHWIRAQDDPPKSRRDGFPRWNHAAFDLSVACSGRASVKLPTIGGSTALRLVPGALPVIPGGDYLVSGKVRTAGLHHARARLVARFADANMEMIPGAVQYSPLLKTNGAWESVSVQLPGAFPNAAWLTIDLELIQPNQFPPGAQGGSLPIVSDAEDVSGAAWFDDITVQIAPVASLIPPSTSGVILGDQPPQMLAIVDDVVGDHLIATMRAIDISGRVIDSETFDPVRPGTRLEWRPKIDRFGWWRIELDVRVNDEVVTAQSQDIVWIPEPTNAFERERFGISLNALMATRAKSLLDLLSGAAVGSVEIPFWRHGDTADTIADSIPRLTLLLEELLSRQLRVGFSLESVPTDLAREQRLGESEIIPALLSGRQEWSPWLDEALTRFGQRVRRWRIGALARQRMLDPRGLASSFVTAAQPLTDSVLNPIPIVPWPIEVEPPDALAGAGIAMIWPTTLPPASVLDLASTWQSFGEITIQIETTNSYGTDQDANTIGLARRALRAWQTNPDRLSIAQPWRWRITRDQTHIAEPTPEFAVWSRLSEHLRGRRVVGELPIANGAVALVLDGEAGGAIVAWNEWAQPERARLKAYLSSESVTVYDIYGNSTVVHPKDGAHEIAFSQSPVFIEGVDAALARFRAGFTVDPPRIESTVERHGLSLLISNPWPVVISGDLQIVQPATWNFAPQTFSFTIAPGEQARFPVQVSFGISEEAGSHTLRARVHLIANERYPTISVDAPIDLNLTGVEIIPSYQIRRDTSGDSVVVTLLVINTGEEPTTLMTYAHAPGLKRQKAPISDLPPRGAAVRSFVFRHQADELKGSEVQVGVIESAGLGRLTRRITIE